MTTTTTNGSAYLSVFVDAATSVFDTMLGAAITPREAKFGDASPTDHDISGMIGLSGDAKGMVALSLSREVALSAAEALLGTRPTDLDAGVADTVGELTNMVAGLAKGNLPGTLNMSLPSVVTGTNQRIEFPSEVKPVRITFDSPWGPAVVEFGFVEAK